MNTIIVGDINNPPKGVFLTLEGVDGAGKSSHIEWLANALREKGKNVVITREPGGTPLGEKLRAILLNEPIHAVTEALLMFAARKEHMVSVIEPALDRGDWVICDRFTDSSFAYQGGGRGVDVFDLDILESLVHSNFQPDITFLFDLPVDIAMSRISGERILDKFESEKVAFHERVRQMYLRRMDESDNRFYRRIQLIDATKTIEEIRESILGILTSEDVELLIE